MLNNSDHALYFSCGDVAGNNMTNNTAVNMTIYGPEAVSFEARINSTFYLNSPNESEIEPQGQNLSIGGINLSNTGPFNNVTFWAKVDYYNNPRQKYLLSTDKNWSTPNPLTTVDQYNLTFVCSKFNPE